MNSLTSRAGVSLAFSLFVTFSAAHGGGVPDEAAVVVTATRTAQLADEVLAPVIVISRAEIERRQPIDVADLLRLHAGIDIGRNGGPGQSASLFLRGTDSNHTLVLIDGVRMNPATIGGAAVHNLDPAVIERIEVVKGPRSTLYGSDAIGGVINIITRRAGDGTDANASVGFGTFDTRRGAIGVRHGGEAGRFGVDLSWHETDGFSPLRDFGPDRGHDRLSVNAHAGRRFGAVDIELSHFEARGQTAYIDTFTFDLLDQDFRNSVSSVTLETAPAANWLARLRLSRMLDEIDQNQDGDFAHTERRVVDLQNDLQLGRAHLVTGGVQLAREETDVVNFGTGFDEERDIHAAYVQDAIEYGAHRGLVAARYTDYEGFGSHVTWDLEYGYWIGEATRVSASAGTAFRAPDATDRFGFGGDPDLGPEESRNLEIGVRHRIAPVTRLSLQLFRNDIENLIEFDFLDRQRMINIGEARIRGIEAGIEHASGPWRLAAEGVLLDPESRSSGQPLPRRARRSLTASLSWEQDRWRLGGDVLAASKRRDSDFSDVELAGYAIAGLDASLRLGEWSVRARLDNLLDKDYALADGFATAGRSVLVELGWRRDGGD